MSSFFIGTDSSTKFKKGCYGKQLFITKFWYFHKLEWGRLTKAFFNLQYINFSKITDCYFKYFKTMNASNFS